MQNPSTRTAAPSTAPHLPKWVELLSGAIVAQLENDPLHRNTLCTFEAHLQWTAHLIKDGYEIDLEAVKHRLAIRRLDRLIEILSREQPGEFGDLLVEIRSLVNQARRWHMLEAERIGYGQPNFALTVTELAAAKMRSAQEAGRGVWGYALRTIIWTLFPAGPAPEGAMYNTDDVGQSPAHAARFLGLAVDLRLPAGMQRAWAAEAFDVIELLSKAAEGLDLPGK